MQQGTSLHMQYFAHVQLHLQDKFSGVGFLCKLKISHLQFVTMQKYPSTGNARQYPLPSIIRRTPIIKGLTEARMHFQSFGFLTDKMDFIPFFIPFVSVKY